MLLFLQLLHSASSIFASIIGSGTTPGIVTNDNSHKFSPLYFHFVFILFAASHHYHCLPVAICVFLSILHTSLYERTVSSHNIIINLCHCSACRAMHAQVSYTSIVHIDNEITLGICHLQPRERVHWKRAISRGALLRTSIITHRRGGCVFRLALPSLH